MAEKYKVSIKRKMPDEVGIIGAKNLSIHEKVLRFLFGANNKFMVLVSVDSVTNLEITQNKDSETKV